ncbi:MAG: ParB/RepB/Spo0J family partition protein [Clostridia bacterium]|nr:ParB/RepB/Spo0J family partition protein [Clostridia bacterium]
MGIELEYIDVDKIDEFSNHPFSISNDNNFKDLKKSIKMIGINTPLILRPKNGERYETISGHRRLTIAKELRYKRVPAFVKNLDDNESVIEMVDSNIHRSDIPPSELSNAYMMKYKAMKSISRKERGTLTSDRTALRKFFGASSTNVNRYLRLTKLKGEMMDLVDERRLSVRAGCELSYLPFEEQDMFLNVYWKILVSPAHSQAMKMRKLSENGKLNEEIIEKILLDQNSRYLVRVKLTEEDLKPFFSDDISEEEIREMIFKSLRAWKRWTQIKNNDVS